MVTTQSLRIIEPTDADLHDILYYMEGLRTLAVELPWNERQYLYGGPACPPFEIAADIEVLELDIGMRQACGRGGTMSQLLVGVGESLRELRLQLPEEEEAVYATRMVQQAYATSPSLSHLTLRLPNPLDGSVCIRVDAGLLAALSRFTGLETLGLDAVAVAQGAKLHPQCRPSVEVTRVRSSDVAAYIAIAEVFANCPQVTFNTDHWDTIRPKLREVVDDRGLANVVIPEPWRPPGFPRMKEGRKAKRKAKNKVRRRNKAAAAAAAAAS